MHSRGAEVHYNHGYHMHMIFTVRTLRVYQPIHAGSVQEASRHLQFHVSLLLVQSVIDSPDCSSALVELHTHEALVQREVVTNGILCRVTCIGSECIYRVIGHSA